MQTILFRELISLHEGRQRDNEGIERGWEAFTTEGSKIVF